MGDQETRKERNPVIGEDLGEVGPDSDAAADGTASGLGRTHQGHSEGRFGQGRREANRPRDPEDRPTDTERASREKGLDKTLADSFPTSDPPSSIPDPDV